MTLKVKDKPIHFYFNFSDFELEDKEGDTNNTTASIQLMRTIKQNNHGLYGDLTITKDDLKQFKDNFDKGIDGYKKTMERLPIDYFHQSDNEAAGWVTELELKNNNNELWGTVEFTPKATEMIRNGEIKFFSPEYTNVFETKTGEVIKNVLFGGGLTNRPFLDMSPIELSENFSVQYMNTKNNSKKKGEDDLMDNTIKLQDGRIMTLQDVIKLQEDVAVKEAEANTAIEEKEKIEEEKKAIEKENEELKSEKEKADQEAEKQLFDVTFSKLIDEGKVVPSIKDSLRKKFSAKELEDFYKEMPQIVKLNDSTGHSSGQNIQLTEAEKRNLKENGGEYSLEDILYSRKRRGS